MTAAFSISFCSDTSLRDSGSPALPGERLDEPRLSPVRDEDERGPWLQDARIGQRLRAVVPRQVRAVSLQLHDRGRFSTVTDDDVRASLGAFLDPAVDDDGRVPEGEAEGRLVLDLLRVSHGKARSTAPGISASNSASVADVVVVTR